MQQCWKLQIFQHDKNRMSYKTHATERPATDMSEGTPLPAAILFQHIAIKYLIDQWVKKWILKKSKLILSFSSETFVTQKFLK